MTKTKQPKDPLLDAATKVLNDKRFDKLIEMLVAQTEPGNTSIVGYTEDDYDVKIYIKRHQTKGTK